MAKIEMSAEEQIQYEQFKKQQEARANLQATIDDIVEEWNDLKEKAKGIIALMPDWKAPWIKEVGTDPQRYSRPVVEFLKNRKEATEGEIIGSFTDQKMAGKVKGMLEGWRTPKTGDDGQPLMEKGKPVFPRSPCLYDPKTGSWKLKPKQ